MIKRIFSVRGATTVEADDVRAITDRSVELVERLLADNRVGGDRRVVHYIISTTDDITACYPATAVRLAGLTDAPVFSCKEPAIAGSLPLCIRVLMELADYGDENQPPRHVYLHGATGLRKDLTGEKIL